MSVYDYIAYHEGTLGTEWGPCFCPIPAPGQQYSGECAACKLADRLEAEGKDYDEARAAALAGVEHPEVRQ